MWVEVSAFPCARRRSCWNFSKASASGSRRPISPACACFARSASYERRARMLKTSGGQTLFEGRAGNHCAISPKPARGEVHQLGCMTSPKLGAKSQQRMPRTKGGAKVGPAFRACPEGEPNAAGQTNTRPDRSRVSVDDAVAGRTLAGFGGDKLWKPVYLAGGRRGVHRSLPGLAYLPSAFRHSSINFA